MFQAQCRKASDWLRPNLQLESGFHPKPFTSFSNDTHLEPSAPHSFQAGGKAGIVGKKASGLADAQHPGMPRNVMIPRFVTHFPFIGSTNLLIWCIKIWILCIVLNYNYIVIAWFQANGH